MSSIALIARRELYGYLRSPLGYCIVAAVLCLHGLLFNVLWMDGERPSYDVLQGFFYQSSGFVAAVAVLLAMRLFAEERQTGTEVLLLKSPVPEWQIVLGKFAGAYVFLCGYVLLTAYMPLLVLVNGKVTGGHVAAGYGGLLLLGAAVMALGTFASSLVSSQLLAAVLGGALTITGFACWIIARKVSGGIGGFVGYLDFMESHYLSFSRGIVKFSSIVYWLSVTYVALLAATASLAARRWRG
ncbi:MAG TPA: ABC transporter permease [Candidatus Binatia bacterium]|nr:ABC transporter permease [Candidatus Binatia bacterium]